MDFSFYSDRQLEQKLEINEKWLAEFRKTGENNSYLCSKVENLVSLLLKELKLRDKLSKKDKIY